MSEAIFWINGEKVENGTITLDIDSPALAFGLGLFESMWFDGRRLLRWNHHVHRLQRSAKSVGMWVPRKEEMERQVRSSLQSVADQTGRVKLTALENRAGESTLTLQFQPGVQSGEQSVQVGIAAESLPSIRSMKRVKSCNYLAEYLSIRKSVELGLFDRLVQGNGDVIVEGCRSNVFVELEDRTVTPPLPDGPLPGVAREAILEAALLEDVPIEQCSITLSQLSIASSIVLTNSVRGAMAVERVVLDTQDDIEPGPGSRALAARFNRLLDIDARQSSLQVV